MSEVPYSSPEKDEDPEEFFKHYWQYATLWRNWVVGIAAGALFILLNKDVGLHFNCRAHIATLFIAAAGVQVVLAFVNKTAAFAQYARLNGSKKWYVQLGSRINDFYFIDMICDFMSLTLVAWAVWIMIHEGLNGSATPTTQAAQVVVGWQGQAGLCLAILALILQGLQYFWARRSFREQREERVNVRAVYNRALGSERPTWILQVYVVNVGRVPVFIKSVGLTYQVDDASASVSIPLQDNKDNPIAPGDDRCFSISGDKLSHRVDIANESCQHISVEIRTPEKTIARLFRQEIEGIGSA